MFIHVNSQVIVCCKSFWLVNTYSGLLYTITIVCLFIPVTFPAFIPIFVNIIYYCCDVVFVGKYAILERNYMLFTNAVTCFVHGNRN